MCDFGLSGFTKGRKEGQMTANYYGTPQYAAPELPLPNHNHKVDIFSFACMYDRHGDNSFFRVWEICTRKRIWAGKISQSPSLVANGIRPDIPENNLPALNALMSVCWAGKPADRPEFTVR